MKSVDPGILSKSVCFSFTPSETAKQLYFYPTWCGHYYCSSSYFMKRQSYPALLVAFIREGRFHVEYRRQTFEAGKGDVILLDCTEPHYYHAHDGLEFLYMHFDGSNSHDICRHILEMNGGALLQHANNVLISRELYNMVEFYAHDGIESMINQSSRIYRIFEYMLTPKTMIKSDSPIERAIHYIKNNVGKNIGLKELANIANMSPYYFAHTFKKQTGFSPIEYVINSRLDRGKIMLVHTPQSVEEIAYVLGYASSNSFINIFVKRVGMSPRQYRRIHQSSK